MLASFLGEEEISAKQACVLDSVRFFEEKALMVQVPRAEYEPRDAKLNFQDCSAAGTQAAGSRTRGAHWDAVFRVLQSKLQRGKMIWTVVASYWLGTMDDFANGFGNTISIYLLSKTHIHMGLSYSVYLEQTWGIWDLPRLWSLNKIGTEVHSWSVSE